jgi:hypothetical protein
MVQCAVNGIVLACLLSMCCTSMCLVRKGIDMHSWPSYSSIHSWHVLP